MYDGCSRPPAPTTPPHLVLSPLGETGQSRHSIPCIAGTTVNFHQGPSATVRGGRYTGASRRFSGTRTRTSQAQAADYPTASVIQPTFYINHASFRQSLYPSPIANTAATPGWRIQVDMDNLATDLWPGGVQSSGAGAGDQVGQQHHRQRKVRASKTHANERQVRMAMLLAQRCNPSNLQMCNPVPEQENATEERRTTWISMVV